MATRLRLSYADYQQGLAAGEYAPPKVLAPFMKVDITRYAALARAHASTNNTVKTALEQLARRTSTDYFRKVYPVQTSLLGHSTTVFPAYRFILPEVLADDWLGGVDWHKWQRDHVLHQPLTAYVAQRILADDGLMIRDKPLIDLCVEQILQSKGTRWLRDHVDNLLSPGGQAAIWLDDDEFARALWKSIVRQSAHLAAAFHDIGYPWQYSELLASNLGHADSGFGLSGADAARVRDLYGHRLVMMPFGAYGAGNAHAPSDWDSRQLSLISASLRETHGMPGALSFLHLNDAVRFYPDETSHPMRQLCVEWAATAIVMHDEADVYWGSRDAPSPMHPYLRLRFDVDPLSFVMFLVDTMQEFERPKASFRRSPDGNPELDYKCACTATEIAYRSANDTITISYIYNDLAAYVEKKRRIGTDNRRLFDEATGYLDASSAGVGRVRLTARMA